jgi:hypothetical protein
MRPRPSAGAISTIEYQLFTAKGAKEDQNQNLTTETRRKSKSNLLQRLKLFTIFIGSDQIKFCSAASAFSAPLRSAFDFGFLRVLRGEILPFLCGLRAHFGKRG